jgi:transketolase
MRKKFFELLHKKMAEDENVYFITADLGFGLADKIREDFPERFFNVGAAETCAMGVGVGLALSGKIPIVYSITPFLLWRAAETIRLYLNHESIPVKLVGSGRNDDYKHDGFSHDATDDMDLLLLFPNIIGRWPDEHSLERDVENLFNENKPFYLNLKR